MITKVGEGGEYYVGVKVRGLEAQRPSLSLIQFALSPKTQFDSRGSLFSAPVDNFEALLTPAPGYTIRLSSRSLLSTFPRRLILLQGTTNSSRV
jgi:hypothetical protein